MRILIPIGVGAIIGYFTNWLAIKMLFRPHYEKKILGISLPFTPGLIPKERERIAKSIGEAVGIHLLSPDTIIDALENKEVEGKIRRWIKDKIASLKEDNKSLKEIITNISDHAYYILRNAMDKKIVSMIIRKIREEEFKTMITLALEERLTNIDLDKTYEIIKEKTRIIINELSNSQDLNNSIEGFLKKKMEEVAAREEKLSEILSQEMIDNIYNILDENEDKIGNAIRENFKDPDTQRQIGYFITELVLQNMPKLILTFISPDIISQKILHIIDKYVDNEETNEYIIIFIKSSIEKLLDTRLVDIFENIDLNNMDYKNISELIIREINREENKELILEKLDVKLRSFEGEAKSTLLNYLKDNIEKMLDSDELETTLTKFTEDILDGFFNKSINDFLDKIKEDKLDMIFEFTKTIFHNFAEKDLPQLIEHFNISQIVEEKINTFDVDFTEELILDIAEKELRAITWLGALLGGIIGIITPLLQLFY